MSLINRLNLSLKCIYFLNKYKFSLSYKADRYDGVTINEQDLPSDPQIFEILLKKSITQWISEKKRGIWLKIPINYSSLIPIGVNQGFRFHHCKKDYLMLVKWLSANEKDNIPSYATHFIGVGGVVIREDTQEILVVKEKISIIKDLWKIPGGQVEFNEILPDAAKREVLEETGVETEFISLMTFRETMNYRFGLPDIYFVCLLKPKSVELKKCDQEIKDIQWMKIQEFVDYYKISKFHSNIGDLIIATIKNRENKNILSSLLWKSENLQFKYGNDLKTQTIYYSDILASTKS